MFGSKILTEIKAVGGMLAGLGHDIADMRATVAVMQRDLADGKAIWAEIRALTGHTATAVTVATTGAAPTAPAPHVVVVPSTGAAPTPAAGPDASSGAGLGAELQADVAAVDPLGGVKLP